MTSFAQKLNRKKYISFDHSSLPRVLTLFDLTALGIGSTVGVGFYILAGEVARNTAGPAVTISFLIAGIASVFAGLCYAEFGARVPKAGSAYVYSYVCVGEFVAFIIGWNLILEYVIGSASVARGYSAYVDTLANYAISTALNNSMHMDVPALSPYPDFFAFGMTLLLACVLTIGVKESSSANNVFTGINIFVILYVIIAGGTLADPANWTLSQEEVDPGNYTVCTNAKDSKNSEHPWGTGGFAPYGFNGIMQGAATCFFGFVGFDVIATTGEEALRPERNIPLSISISLLCIFLAYFGMSTVLTLALPYCMEDPNAPLIVLFDVNGMEISKWIVSVGAIFGFSASLLGAMFPMPRVIYAMADDGILFRFLSRIHKRFKTPLIATWVSATFAGVMALLFTLNALVDMMSIGTLMAYTIVSVCVMLLRYANTTVDTYSSEYTLLKYASDNDNEIGVHDKKELETDYLQKDVNIQFSLGDYFGQMFNFKNLREPTELSSSFVNYATISYCLLAFLSALFLTLYGSELIKGDAGVIVLIVVFFGLALLNVIAISRQPMSAVKLTFKVPFVPWIPALSAFINLYLMCNLTTATWIRFGIWMIIGLLIYFLYGLKNSTGSQAPARLSLNGKDNYGLDHDMSELMIPPIVIEPPTPMNKRSESEDLVRPPLPRRQSIIDSPLVTGDFGDLQKEKMETQPHNIITVFTISESTSQSADISKRAVESKSEPSSDSDSDCDNDEDTSAGSDDKKTSSTVIVTAATVYVSDDPNNYHDTSKEELAFAKSGFTSEGVKSAEKEESNPDSHYQNIEECYSKADQPITEKPDSADRKQNEVDKDNSEPIYAVIDKSKKTKYLVEPLHLPEVVANENESLEDQNLESFRKLVATYSSPLPTYLSDLVSNSVPASPKTKKHPFKLLRRASSFDNIPPSSCDSPHARRVNNFVIIPVKVPLEEQDPKESNVNQSSETSPGLSIATQAVAPSEDQLTEDLNMANELNKRLTKLEDSDLKLELVSSDDVSKKVASTIPADIASNAKGRDILLPPLDTIRERGESQLVVSDNVLADKDKKEIFINGLLVAGQTNAGSNINDVTSKNMSLTAQINNNKTAINELKDVNSNEKIENMSRPVEHPLKPRSLIRELLIDAQPIS